MAPFPNGPDGTDYCPDGTIQDGPGETTCCPDGTVPDGPVETTCCSDGTVHDRPSERALCYTGVYLHVAWVGTHICGLYGLDVTSQRLPDTARILNHGSYTGALLQGRVEAKKPIDLTWQRISYRIYVSSELY